LFYIDNQILSIFEHPWYKDLVYYLQNHRHPDNLDTHQRRRLHLESSRYVILGDFLFRRYVDGILLPCVNNEEAHKLLQETHGSSNSSFMWVATFLLRLLLLILSRKGTIGLQFSVILIIFQDLVTSARISLGKNIFFSLLYNMSSLNFLFQNGIWTLSVLLILHPQQGKFSS
jgi:hypothetical protein